jgi:hypothetical protein
MDPPGQESFPRGYLRLRYRAFDPREPCGKGCLYHCCDPLITSFNIKDAPDLPARLERLLEVRRNEIARLAPSLEFGGLSLPQLPAVAGIDTAAPPPGFLQVSLLWRCRHLAAGLCAIYGRPRPIICTRYVHCPEHRAPRLGEEDFLELAEGYWRLRRLVLGSAATTVAGALARRK